MLIIGDVPAGRHVFRSLYSKKGFTHYQKLCTMAHSHDCKISAQLHQSDSNRKAMLKYIPGFLMKRITPDQLRSKLNEEISSYITNLDIHKVKKITLSFGESALRAKAAGFDMVQIHGDRMCGSFSSPLFNKRTDEYGGSIENRLRFALESIKAVRQTVPDLPIDFKLAVRQENPHYGNAGILLEELPIVIPLLEQAGVSSFHIALANHAKLTDTIPAANHPYFPDEGCFLRYCDEVRQYTRLPICGVGGLTSLDFIEAQLAEGRVDCVAMSRQLIADPEWPSKAISGTSETIRRCIRCNRDCLGGMQRHEGVHCIYDKKDKKA